jgi:hypothetical protein
MKVREIIAPEVKSDALCAKDRGQNGLFGKFPKCRGNMKYS